MYIPLRNKYIQLRHSTKGGAVALLLNKIVKRPMAMIRGGSIGSNRIMGIISFGRPSLPNARSTIAGGDLLNSINFNKNARNLKKSSNIKFIY